MCRNRERCAKLEELSCRTAFCFFAALCALVAQTKQAAPKAKASAKTATTKATTSKSPAAKGKALPASKTTPTKSTASKSTKAPAPPKRTGQSQPTADRYKEIQQALADRGFFTGQVDGNWGPSSLDALKRFQASQNLDVDGKLGALSLIALGLGPKRAYVQTTPIPVE